MLLSSTPMCVCIPNYRPLSLILHRMKGLLEGDISSSALKLILFKGTDEFKRMHINWGRICPSRLTIFSFGIQNFDEIHVLQIYDEKFVLGGQIT